MVSAELRGVDIADFFFLMDSGSPCSDIRIVLYKRTLESVKFLLRLSHPRSVIRIALTC